MYNRYCSVSLVAIGMAILFSLTPDICGVSTNVQEKAESNLASALNVLRHSTSEKEKADALETIRMVKNEINGVLIETLKKENKKISDWNIKYGEMDVREIPKEAVSEEGEEDFYCDLIEMVTNIKDEAVLPALIGALSTGGRVQKTVADYGEIAVLLLVETLTSHQEALIRSEAIATLGLIIAKYKLSLSKDSIAVIKTALTKSLNDKDGPTRREVVHLVGCLGDSGFVEQIRKLSQEDQYKIVATEEGSGEKKTLYPVREEALKTLELLKHKQ